MEASKRSTIRTLGPVGFNPAGEYQEDVTYQRLDVVSHNGSSYVALQETLGNDVTNQNYWQRIAEGGIHMNYDATLKALNIAINGIISYNSERKELNITTA